MGGGKRSFSPIGSSWKAPAPVEPQEHADVYDSGSNFGSGGDDSGPADLRFSPSRHHRLASGRIVPVMDEAGSSRATGAGAGSHRREGSASGEMLECAVGTPIKEGDGTKDAFISYLITTHSTFPSFQKQHTQVRRRFTDFVYLHKTLSRDHVACAIPPMPTKERMEYIRGDRFGPDFTSRRAKSLQRFLFRLTQHPVLRRAEILHLFLESNDWNATMNRRSARNSVTEGSGVGGSGGNGMFDNLTDSLLNAFAKVNRPNQRFIEVRDRCTQLEDNLSHVEKVVSRVARREGELETDLRELAEQFQKLITLEPGVEDEVRAFAAAVEDTASGFKRLHDMTDQDYVGSLHDMQAYSVAFKGLLKTRDQKQVDHEHLVEYLNKAQVDRDSLLHGSMGGSSFGGGGGASSVAGSFLRSRFENMQGMDPEQARRDKIRRLEMEVDRLTPEVSAAKKTTELFDEEVVREAADFERIRRVEFKYQLSGLADAHIELCDEVIKVWEQYAADMVTPSPRQERHDPPPQPQSHDMATAGLHDDNES